MQHGLQGHETLLGRYGGEEFVLVLAGSTQAEAMARAAAIRTALQQPARLATGPVTFTASIGLAMDDGQGELSTLLAAADAALYRAKAAGRDRLACATPAEISRCPSPTTPCPCKLSHIFRGSPSWSTGTSSRGNEHDAKTPPRAGRMLASLMLAGCSQSPSAGAEGASDAPSRRFGTIDFQPCTLSTEGASANVEAQCATLQVPEDRAQPGWPPIGLRIAWLESGSSASQPDPVFFLAGGPGQAASEVAVIVDTALRQVRKQRDVFLIDQRGTGGSNPLSCLGADGKELQMDEDAAPSEASLRDYAQRCAASLQGVPTHASTPPPRPSPIWTRCARRLAWTGSTWSGSYGTRVAQRYAGAYPQHTRSIVIDGVVPNELVVGGDFATTFEDAIALQSAQCRKDAACSKRFPTDTRAQLRSVVETLRRAPVRSSIAIPAPTHPAGCADAGQRGRPGLRLLLRAAVFLAAAAGAG
jgi:pimeloyl-ACP methyl ester carboxylesterase